MRTMQTLILMFAATACTVATSPTTDAPVTPTNVWTVTWSDSGKSDSPGVPDPVLCTAVIYHPCPFLLYTQQVTIDADQTPLEAGKMLLEWSHAAGGADFNGRPAEQQPPVYEDATPAGDTLVLKDIGDGAGDRHEATLTKNTDGAYEGDVTWSLFTVAGHTTWHLVITQ